MDNTRVAIISYAHDNVAADNFNKMIAELACPDYIELEVFLIENATNAASAFNQGMEAAKDIDIKLFVEEGVEILSVDLLIEGINYLNAHREVVMLGITGTDQVHSDGISYMGVHRINDLMLSDDSYLPGSCDIKDYSKILIDGGVFFTTMDIKWRDDLFATGYFLGPSQSVEFRRNGFKVGIMKSGREYIRYNNDISDLQESERLTFLDEYSKDILPLVTVLCPSYRFRFLEDALTSVLSQDYRNIEIFISDDSETDDSEKIIKCLQKNDSRILYERHPGITAHQNWLVCDGYNNPKAEFENWLMDDDVFLPHKISRMVDAFLDNPEVTIVSSVRNVIDSDGNIIGLYGLPGLRKDIIIGSEDAALQVLGLNNFIGEPSTAMVRKSVMPDGHRLGYPGSELKYPDGDTWLNALEYGKLYYYAEPYSCFRQHPDQGSSDLRELLIILIGQGNTIMHYLKTGKFFADTAKFNIVGSMFINRVGQFLNTAYNKGYKTDEIEKELLNLIVEISNNMLRLAK